MRIKFTDDENDDIIDPSEFLNNFDFPTDFQPENEMAAVKKEASAKAEPKVKAPKVKVEKTAKGVFGPREIPEGYVGLNALAEELGITASVARRKLRGLEGVTKPEGQHGWYWKDGSRELNNIRKALTPAAE